MMKKIILKIERFYHKVFGGFTRDEMRALEIIDKSNRDCYARKEQIPYYVGGSYVDGFDNFNE